MGALLECHKKYGQYLDKITRMMYNVGNHDQGEKRLMSITKATEKEIQAFLNSQSGWSIMDGKLHKTYTFQDFIQAFGFMAQAALYAERDGHHPEWFNVYNRVVVDLTTHEADGITEMDLELGRRMDELALR
jgi:4a-hydroxytetrahydrobiopterin dehydratase